MNYRNIFLEFLYEFKDYSFENFQLLLFENLPNDDLVSFLAKKEEIEVYQAKMSQVFNKKISFSNLKNSVVELLFMSGEVTTYELSSIGTKYNDLYNFKLLTHSTSKYLTIYPIFNDRNLIGGIFIYSNYQLKWNLTETKIFKLINDLQNAKNSLLEKEIDNTTDSPYWMLIKDKIYLSNQLSISVNANRIINKEELEIASFKEILSTNIFDTKLVVLKEKKTSPLFSMLSIKNEHLDKFTLLYVRTNEDQSLDELYNDVLRIIDKQDIVNYECNLYQASNDSIIIVYNEIIAKSKIEKVFAEFKYILVRYGNEITSKPDFKILIDYLNICPIEEFNQTYYKFYLENYYRELKEEVLNKINTSKIVVQPVVKSIGMTKAGVLIRDSGEVNKFNKNLKLKSLNAIFKILPEYQNEQVFLELPISYFFENDKLSLSHLNLMKRHLTNNCYVLTDFNENIKKILAQWPEFIKKIIVFDDSDHLYRVINISNNVGGIYFNSYKYSEFFEYNRDHAMNFIDFILRDCELILVKVKQADIIRYYHEKILLVCE